MTARIKSLKSFGKLFNKIICVFDDLPFLFKKGFLPKSFISAGLYVLAGAGLFIFPKEICEAVIALKKAYLDKNHPHRRMHIITNLIKIGCSIPGFAVSAALLAFIITGLVTLSTIFAVAIPAIVTVISAIELYQNAYVYHHAKKAYADCSSSKVNGVIPENQDEMISSAHTVLRKAERKLVFASIFSGISLIITTLALISTLGALGIGTFGIAPAACIVSVVCIALALNIFQIMDKRKKCAYTTTIRNFFTRSKKSEDDKKPRLTFFNSNSVINQKIPVKKGRPTPPPINTASSLPTTKPTMPRPISQQPTQTATSQPAIEQPVQDLRKTSCSY